MQAGQEKVIAYASKSLTKCQRNYCVTRKELLAVHTFVMQFGHYILSRRFRIRTDHNIFDVDARLGETKHLTVLFVDFGA